MAASTLSLLAGASARAQVTSEPSAAIFPDPAKFARGLYTEGELGAVAFFGKAGDDVSPGVAVGARLGYDITRWLAVQAHLLGSTHGLRGEVLTDANGRPLPLGGQILQTYQGTVEAKLTYRFVQWSMFAEGGLGAARMSTNLFYALGLAHLRTGLTAGGGLGVDYHSLSRHFSVGARAGFFLLRDVTGSQDLIATTYLRYTF
jgi:Outer membrane protein beta-barrel domain